MGDTKPFCDLCEMLPNGRHVFGCPADDGAPSAAPAPDTMREKFEAAAYKLVDDWQGDQHADGTYFFPREQEHWEMWQAALKTAMATQPAGDSDTQS